MHANNKVFTSALKEHRAALECRENSLTYSGRFYYMKRIPCKIGGKEDKDAYAYLGLDVSMGDQQKPCPRERLADQGMADGDVYDSLSDYGLFMLITFISSVILVLLRDRLSDSQISVSALFEELRHQQGIVYEDAIIPSVPAKKMNDIYKLFKIKCLDEIPFDGTSIMNV